MKKNFILQPHALFRSVMTITLLSLACVSSAQVTLAFQGGNASDTWGYTSTGADAVAAAQALSSSNYTTGPASIVVGGNTAGGNCFDVGTGNGPNVARTFTFNNVDITSSNNSTRTLVFHWGNRFPVCTGTGWDSGENLVFTAYHDGVAQPSVTLATGFNNATFDIHTNQYTWSIPTCVNHFYFVVTVTTNRRDELLFLDDVKLSAPVLNPPVLQPSAITGPVDVCQGSTATYSVIQVSGIVYTWSGLPAGASFTTPNGSTAAYTIGVNWGTAASGTYTLNVTPADQCGATTGPAQTASITIHNPTAATITAGGPLTFCAGGSVQLAANTGTGISWSTGETDSVITVNATGTYTLTVTDMCGTATDAASITIQPSTSANITPSGPTTFCPGGSVMFTSSATSGNSWSTGETTSTITVNTTGTYVLTVTDACGTATDTMNVLVNPSPMASITPGGPTTFCAGGSVTLTSSSATGNNWSTGETTNAITVNSTGTYTLNVTNVCGTASDSVSVTVNPLTTASITPSGPTTFCPGGSVVLNSSAGSGNSWSTGETTNSITASTSGTYVLTVSGICGTASDSVNVTVNPSPVASITPSGPTTFCTGGSVTLTSSSVTGNSWSTGATSNSITVSTSGTYTLTVTNSCGTATASQIITVNPATTASITPSGPTTFCAGGSVTLTSSSATGNSWSTGATSNSITVSTSGTYTLTVTGTCGTAFASTTVTVNPLPTASISGTTTDLCPGDSLLLTASGGNTYLWSVGATTNSIYVDAPGSYTVTASNGCGNVTSAPYVVNALNNPVAAITGASALCPGSVVHLIGSGGTSYGWSTGESTAAIDVNTAGTYIFTAINSCGSDTAKAEITADPIAALFTADPLSGMAPLTVNFTNLSTGSPTGFLWDFGNGSTSSLVSPSTVYNDGGTYAVTLVATSSAGCHASYSLSIEVGENPSLLVIPNVFSPNGDHVNDIFLVQAAFINSFDALVFDRWGKQVAHWNNAAAGWDGTDENGKMVSEGTYFYIITATGNDKKAYNENGQLTLFR